jgi:hypothetical protein
VTVSLRLTALVLGIPHGVSGSFCVLFCCLLLIEPIPSLLCLFPRLRPLYGHSWVCLTHTCGDGSSIQATANVLGPRRPPFLVIYNCQFQSPFYQLQPLVTSSTLVSITLSTVYSLLPAAHLSSPFANIENKISLFR